MPRRRHHEPRRKIGEGRKATYYVGMALVAFGFLTFFSIFVSAIGNFGDFTNFEEDAKSSMTRAMLGIGMVVTGGILANIGARGLAGSGVVLDPERARRDVEPWARMGGGVVKDALDEAGIDLGRRREEPEPEQDFDERLRKLHQLHEDGILSAEEYAREKREILDQL